MENYLTPALISLLILISPITPLIYLVIFAVFLDTLMGIYTSVKLHNWKSFTSHKLFNIVPKLFLYISTILLLFFLDKFILNSTTFGIEFLLTKSISFLWIYIELKSMDENSIKLGNKPIMVVIKSLMKKLLKFKKDISELTDFDNNLLNGENENESY